MRIAHDRDLIDVHTTELGGIIASMSGTGSRAASVRKQLLESGFAGDSAEGWKVAMEKLDRNLDEYLTTMSATQKAANEAAQLMHVVDRNGGNSFL
ncbi:hypothetical protein ACFVUS_27065 [Nocardia sp. NPDC058058]|uniref:hypothetical protein n=1 Tax=Nocardia sp. NPDC058058 TaxID=3346317 RepID=UPI0036D7B828